MTARGPQIKRRGGRPKGPITLACVRLIQAEPGIELTAIMARMEPAMPPAATPARKRIYMVLHSPAVVAEIYRHGRRFYPRGHRPPPAPAGPWQPPPPRAARPYDADHPHPAVVTYRAEKAAASRRRHARQAQVMAEARAILAQMDANAPRSRNGHRQAGHSARREDA